MQDQRIMGLGNACQIDNLIFLEHQLELSNDACSPIGIQFDTKYLRAGN